MSETTQNTDTAVSVPSKRGWFGRNWKWCTPLLILVLVVVVGGVIVAFPILKLRASQPYKIALEAVQADPAVTQKLGEPVKAGWTLSGDLTEDNCQIFFEVSGPNGTANVTGQARTFSEDNVWSFSLIEVTFTDGTKVSVKTADEEGGLEEAPAWGE